MRFLRADLTGAVFALLASCSLVAAQESAATAERGQQQFKQTCGFCHGVNGDGGAEGPSLIRSALVRHDENGELIGPVIREGRPDKGMPAMSLTPAQIADTVAFLHAALKKLDRTSPDKPRRDHYSLEVLSVGKAEAGKAFFRGAGGCAGCHSPAGDLAGIVKRFSPPDLQTRFLYPTGKPATVVVTLRSGAVVKGNLVRMDDFFVAMQDQEGWYHSWPLSAVKAEPHDPLAAHQALLKTITNANIHDLFAYLETLN